MGKSRYYLFAIPVLFIAALTAIMFHDDRAPDSLTEREKVYVLGVVEQANKQMDNVIQQLNQIIEQPELDLDRCTELAESIHRWCDTMDTARNEPVFFVPFPEASERNARLLSKIETELDEATTSFIKHASGRTATNNQEALDILIIALSREEKVDANAPCIAKECVWCRSRETLMRFLIRHAT